MSDSLQSHGLQHASLPCPSLSPEVCSNSLHWVSDTIQSSHSLLPAFPPALNLSQQQDLFEWVCSSHQMAKILEFQLQHQSFQWIFRVDFLQNWQVGSSCSLRDSSTIAKKHYFSALRWWTGKPGVLQSMGLQRVRHDWATELNWIAFFMVQLSHPHMTTEKIIVLTIWTFVGKVKFLLFNMLSRFVIGEGNGTPLQYSCLNSIDGGAW